MKRVAVIGGGASGMIAAYAAAENNEVTLFEKNEKLGKKIYITGKGRCNVTNACLKEDFFKNVISNPKFMYKSFNLFSNQDLINFIESNGVKLKVERGDRVFPLSDHASDITKALISAMASRDVKIRLNKTVEKIVTENIDGTEKISYLIINGKREDFDACILACGGASYAGAGGSMLGYELAKDLGHRIEDIMPSLVPFNVREEYIKQMTGLSLKNVTLNIFIDNKCVFKEMGEMLFTHFGVSGPLVLTASAMLGKRLEDKSLRAYIDLKPAIPENQLDKRLVRIIEENGKKNGAHFFDGLVPRSMIPVMLKLCQIKEDEKIYTIGREKRKEIGKYLKEFPFTITGTRGFNEAIVTKGGVDVKEVNPKTMESKLVSGLYICGEMLDIDALTGGFNLQCAFSTGYTAGRNV